MITIGRRQFLHNAGRLMLLPIFQGLLSEKAFAAAKSGTWVHLYFPMGCVGGDWKIDSLDKIPDFLKDFRTDKDKMIWFSNANNPINGAGGHEQAGGGALTAATNNKTLFFDTSADQILAREMKDLYPNGAMTLSRNGFTEASNCCRAIESGLNYISWTEAGKNAKPIVDPALGFKSFFGGAASVDNLEASLADGKSSLDFFTNQVAAAKAKIGKEDAVRLDEYTQAMRDYELSVKASLATKGMQCRTDTVLKNSDNFKIHQDSMFELIALALQCNVAPAITYIMDHEFSFQNYSFAGVNDGFHNVTHHLPTDKGMIESHRKINGHYAAQFARLVGKVRDLKDSNGNSVLNSSIISMGSGMGESEQHNRTQGIPMVLAGGKDLGVPQGKVYAPSASMSEILRTILIHAGVSEAKTKTFGVGQGNLIGKV